MINGVGDRTSFMYFKIRWEMKTRAGWHENNIFDRFERSALKTA